MFVEHPQQKKNSTPNGVAHSFSNAFYKHAITPGLKKE